jgi:tetratricopeptide (TPR) repeat protein
MKRIGAYSFFIALLGICLLDANTEAVAGLWGHYYVSNDMMGRCSDGRLTPDVRIAECEKTISSGLVHRDDAMLEYDLLADAFGDKCDFSSAIAIYTKTLTFARESEIPEQRYIRGMAYLSAGQPDLATADFEFVILQYNESRGYQGLAEVAADAGRYAEAINLYNKVIKRTDTMYWDWFAGRADVYARMGEYDKALADENQVLENYPQYSGAYNSRCWIRAVLGRDLDAALDDCNHSLWLQPENLSTLDSKGLVEYRQKKWDAAIADYSTVLAYNPYYASSLYMRGISKIRKGDADGGNQDIQKAEAIYPPISQTYAIYGIAP